MNLNEVNYRLRAINQRKADDNKFQASIHDKELKTSNIAISNFSKEQKESIQKAALRKLNGR